MSVGTLAACGGSSSSSDNGKGKVYFLNFKPESNDEWQKLAKDYTKETGVEVKVQTAASGTYEQTLKSEIAKSEAPTLFQVNGPVGYQNWKSYTDDMTDTEPYKQLINKDVASRMGARSLAFHTLWRLWPDLQQGSAGQVHRHRWRQDQGRQGYRQFRYPEGRG